MCVCVCVCVCVLILLVLLVQKYELPADAPRRRSGVCVCVCMLILLALLAQKYEILTDALRWRRPSRSAIAKWSSSLRRSLRYSVYLLYWY